jgi:hypothetical protein
MTPAVLLIVVLLFTARDIFDINTTNPQVIYQALRKLPIKQISFKIPERIYERKKGQTLIYIFGESSLIISNGKTFSYYLNEDRDNLHVVNLGICGVSSFSIRKRVVEALNIAKPDIIVLYFGHNDYNNIYQGFMMPRYYDKFQALLWFAHFLGIGTKNPSVRQYDNYYWYSRLIRPKLFKLFERLKLIDVRQDEYEPINKYILDNYIANSSAIIDLASSKGIPVVFITPICNLRAEPFGDVETTTFLYDKGMSTRNYYESIEYLKKAKDKEMFTYDLRAKTPLVNYIRNLSHPNVYVLDLEKQLEDRKFEFGYSNFLDYLHFNDSTHHMVADTLYKFIKDKKLIDERK